MASPFLVSIHILFIYYKNCNVIIFRGIIRTTPVIDSIRLLGQCITGQTTQIIKLSYNETHTYVNIYGCITINKLCSWLSGKLCTATK